MAQTFEGTLQSLLQGVSQQIPRERQPGQQGAQQNMLSDPVTGLRRRPPAYLVGSTDMPNPSDDALFTSYIERGTDGRHLLINTQTGTWQIRSKDTATLIRSGQSDYLKATIGATSIQTASIEGLTYILNTEKSPVASVNNTGKLNPNTTGFFYATSSTFSKQWSVTVSSDQGTWVGTYEVGPASDDGAAAEAATSSVVAGLATSLVSGAGMPDANVVRFQNYLFFKGMTNVVVSSDVGTTYARWSNQSRVDEESDLPAQLPSSANGCMCRVGKSGKNAAWYRFNYSKRQWFEDSAYDSITEITNMPLELAADDNIIVRNFEGRLAGDADNNQDPGFVENGYITGIAAFQGRLVLLSGGRISMSASGLYQRFYRSSVTSLLDNDRIDIGAASAQDSVFRSALQFNRDLVLFGDSIQAVIPGNNVLTPTNASVTLTSEFSCDSRITPVVTGQTILYANRRNNDYAGLLEFIPSAYTSSQYVSQDATAHLPRYIPGRLMGLHVSSVTNVALFRYSGTRNALIVYEFMWGADAKKVQGAYHKWVLPYTVLSLHTLSEVVYLFTAGVNGYVQVLKIDPREGFVAGAPYDKPFLDAPVNVTVQGGSFYMPAHMRIPGISVSAIALSYSGSGLDSGAELGVSEISNDWLCKVVRGVPDGTYSVGLRYLSLTTLTPPMLKDHNDNLIGSGHVRLLRLDIALRNSGIVDILIEDTARDVYENSEYSGILMNSKELTPGLPLKVALANIVVPCRTNTDTTDVTISTDGTLEMNLMDVSYILRYNQRRRRV